MRCRPGSSLFVLAALKLACGPGKPVGDGDAAATSTTDPTPTTTAFEPTAVSFGSATEGGMRGSTSGSSTGSGAEPDPPDPGGVETGSIGSTGLMMGSSTEPDPDPSTTGDVEVTCETYCEVYLDACAGFGEYDDEDACLDQCAQWPSGAPGATAGDSLHCRAHYAAEASMDAAMHCPPAGPSGAGVCVDPNAPTCADYCAVYLENCTGMLDLYADMDDCMAQCAGWYPGSMSDVSGDTVGCRTYHAGAAEGDPDTHCPHAGPDGGHVCVVEG